MDFTVEPPNNGHIGTDHFRGKNVLPLYIRKLVHQKVSFIVSFIQSVLYQRFHCTTYMCVYHTTCTL